MDAAKLHDAIAAACPIVGITIGREDDRSTWSITFAPEATAAQKDAGQAILATFVPPPQLTFQQFRALFTPAENAAIMTAAQSSPAIMDWLFQAASAGAIDMGNALVGAGLDALIAAGLLTEERRAMIIAGTAPPA